MIELETLEKVRGLSIPTTARGAVPVLPEAGEGRPAQPELRAMQLGDAVPEAGLMNGTRLAIVLLMAVVLAGPVAAETFTIEYLPSLYVMDAGAGGHMMNNYTIETDANDIGAWTVLGTDNQMEFAHLDGRNVSFAAGVSQQFYTPSLTNYRYYYILLQSGFSIGSTIEMHFNHTNPPQTPTYLTQKMFNFTVKRSPIVLLFDFNQTGAGPNLANYSILSSDSLANSQDWVLYGTDTAEIIGYSDPGIFTEVDRQTAEGFTAGVKKTYEFTTTQHFRYYVLYLSSGWYTVGTDVEIRFGTGVPAAVLPAGPLTISAVVGESWIQYSWTSTQTNPDMNVTAFVDGKIYTNTSETTLILNGLNPMEEHRLALYNTSNFSQIRGTATATTRIPATTVYTFSGITIALLIVSMVLIGGWISSITSLFATLSSAVLGVMVSGYWQVYSFALYGVAVIALMILIWNLYSLRRQRYV